MPKITAARQIEQIIQKAIDNGVRPFSQHLLLLGIVFISVGSYPLFGQFGLYPFSEN